MKRLLVVLFPVICVAVLVISWGVLHNPAAGETEAPPESGGYGSNADLSGMAFRVILALGLIVLLIVRAVYAIRVPGARHGTRLPGGIRVLDRCYLAPKRALFTVRMVGRVVVVGVTESSITPVLELSAEEGEQRFPETPLAEEESGRFSGILKAMAGKGRSR